MTSVKEQLEELIVQYTPLLHSLIRRCITTDYHDAWDAYQDICLHLWEYIPSSFDPSIGTELFVYFRCSVFNTVKHYKRRHRYRRLEPPIYREHFTDRLMGISYDTDTSLIDYLLARANTPLKKKVLCMYIDGYTPTEVVKALKISRSCIYKYLRYFRKIIQEYRNVHI